MTVTALAPKKIDERAALREAVAAAAEARDAVAKAKNAIEAAERLVAANQTKLARATKAVADAQAEDAKQLAAAISAGGASAARATRQARAAQVEAADDLENARRALASLKVDLTDAEADAAVAARAVDRALAETLGPVARRLLEEVRERHARFLMTQAALSAVGSLCGDPWSETRKEIDRAGLFTDALARLSSATEKEWLDAIKALRENADAPLPE